MKEACKECRILVIRKRENREYGGTKVVTSVWCLSDDHEVRLQQKLSESQETVPYCSYFEPEKVSLEPPDEPGAGLRFHAEEWGGMLKEEKKTNWINYYFAIESDAINFQSAVFGRMLLGSFRTTKTTVIHKGILGAFAFEEQFANIELLRLWEEDGVETPGAVGGVMALMHISSSFGEGWARWWINNSRQPVTIKEDGVKYARVKGIDVTVVRPGATARRARSASSSVAGVVDTSLLHATPPLPSTSPSLSPSSSPSPSHLSSSSFQPQHQQHQPQHHQPIKTTSAVVFPTPPLPPTTTTTTTTAVPITTTTTEKESSSSSSSSSFKKVSGVRIEFKNEEERGKFLHAAELAQMRSVPLPEL